MKTKIHAAAGGLAMVCIATFWSSTLWSELFASQSDIVFVKTAVLWGMLVLIPSMMTVGGSGFSLGAKWKSPLVARKKLRMKFIGANGMLILLPSAFFLASRAQAGQFDSWFYIVQVVELIAGAINFTLLSLNMRDGLAIARRRQQK